MNSRKPDSFPGGAELQGRIARAEASAGIGYWEWDSATKESFWSPGMKALYGLAPDDTREITLEFFFSFVHPDDGTTIETAVKSALEQKQPAEMEFRIRLQDGTEKWIISRAEPLLGPKGTIIGLYGTNTDITRLKASELKLQESEALHRTLTKNFPNGALFLFDRNFKYLAADGTVFAQAGLDPEEVVGRTVAEVFPESWDFMRPYHERTLQGEETYYDLWYNGRLYSNHFLPVHNDAGKVIQGIVVVHDITQSRAAEEQQQEHHRKMREQNALLRGILDNVPDIIGVQHTDHTIVQYNKTGYELLQMSEADVQGKKCFELIGRDEPCVVCASKIALKTGEMHTLEKYVPELDMFLHCRSNPIFDDDGEVKYIIELLRDITEQKMYEQELISAKEKAEAANIAKSSFLNNMSHELRTPLSGLTGMLRLIEASSDNEDHHEFIKHAVKSCDRLTLLVNDILEITKFEKGNIQLINDVLDFTELLETVRDVFSGTIQQESVVFSIHQHHEMPKYFYGDALRLKQLLFHLVGNAFKFTPAGNVAVRVAPVRSPYCKDFRVLISVSDTGVGIPEEKIDFLFAPFAQAEDSFTRRFQGAGLGLGIVKQLVDLMGGSIAVESEEQHGSTFHIVIPLQPADEAALQDVHPPAQELSSGGGKVLIVEDDYANRLALQGIVKNCGYEVHSAETGEQALDILKRQTFDLILMDIQLPDTDGVALTKTIRTAPDFRHTAAVPIVAVTAYSLPEEVDIFLEAGMNDHLPKPLEADAVKTLLHKHLRERSTEVN